MRGGVNLSERIQRIGPKLRHNFFICFKQQNTLSMLAIMILVQEFLMSEFDDSVIDLKDVKILSTFETRCIFK